MLTDLDGGVEPGQEALCGRGRIASQGGTFAVELLASPAFRELVAFTPPHRQAVCLEPYTCTTDAINLQQRGINAGLRVLAPGEQWAGVVEMVRFPV